MASKELQAALDAAQAAAEVIRSLYQKNITVKTKPDASPVTEADVRAEEVIKSVLSERFPTYGFYGEETGQQAMDAENIWLVDPIDGTKSFVRECPFFSTQIALLRAGRFVLGVSSAPAYDELALGGERRRCLPQRRSPSGSARSRSWRVHRVGGQPEDSGALTAMESLRRSHPPGQPYPWLWRLRALPPACEGLVGCGDRVDVDILDIAALTVLVGRPAARLPT